MFTLKTVFFYVLIVASHLAEANPVDRTALDYFAERSTNISRTKPSVKALKPETDISIKFPWWGPFGIFAVVLGGMSIASWIDERIARSVDAQKQLEYEKILKSDDWSKGVGVPSCADGDEVKVLNEIGRKGREEVTLMGDEYWRRFETTKRKTTLEYYKELDKIRERHGHDKHCKTN